MNILISTFGERGDVQPYLALAVGLQAEQANIWLRKQEAPKSALASSGPTGQRS